MQGKKLFVLQGKTEKEVSGMEPGEEHHLCYRGCGGAQIKRIGSKLMGLIKINLGLTLDLAPPTMTFFMKHKCPIKTTVQSQL